MPHPAAVFMDNNMHDLQLERFYKIGQTFNDQVAMPDGPIKTFTLRGIKDSPPYLHDGRLLTLDDTVEFFNLVLGTKLTQKEKADLVPICWRSRRRQTLIERRCDVQNSDNCLRCFRHLCRRSGRPDWKPCRYGAGRANLKRPENRLRTRRTRKTGYLPS